MELEDTSPKPTIPSFKLKLNLTAMAKKKGQFSASAAEMFCSSESPPRKRKASLSGGTENKKQRKESVRAILRGVSAIY
jgi:hypothetical protein